jgi:molybdopterin synthase sulfur carrier subunit
MLNVLFFARIREELNCQDIELEWAETIADIDRLQAFICSERGQLWFDVLGQENMIRAVNQKVITGNCALSDGDEIAFFPPVTGG